MSDLQVNGASAAAETLQSRYVLPGELFVSAAPTRYTTILGSCVAVCLYDNGAGIGGLNHFLLPGQPATAIAAEAGRWGSPAIAELLRRLQESGARRGCIHAKVFGGAQIASRDVPAHLRVGERNIENALAELERHRIPVMNRSVGGRVGRKIIFESHTGIVWARELGPQGAGPPPPG